jgi:hypothetical protein
VHEDLDAVRAQRDRMPGCRYRNHLAVTGRAEHRAGRIDGDAVAEHALRERGIGRFGERRAPASER